jgi:hypothetical protein
MDLSDMLHKDPESPHFSTRSSMNSVDGFTIHALDWKKQPCCNKAQLPYPIYTNKAQAPLNVDPDLWKEFREQVNLLLNSSFKTFVIIQFLCFVPFLLDVWGSVFLFKKTKSLMHLHHLWHALLVFVVGYVLSEFLKERMMRSEVHPNFLRLVADWTNKFEEKGVLIEYVVEDRSSIQVGGVKQTESFLRFKTL